MVFPVRGVALLLPSSSSMTCSSGYHTLPSSRLVVAFERIFWRLVALPGSASFVESVVVFISVGVVAEG